MLAIFLIGFVLSESGLGDVLLCHEALGATSPLFFGQVHLFKKLEKSGEVLLQAHLDLTFALELLCA